MDVITEEHWDLAGVVMAVSNAARAEIQATLCAKASEANKRRGRAEGKREAESAKRQA